MKRIKSICVTLCATLLLTSCCGTKTALKNPREIKVNDAFSKVYDATQAALDSIPNNKWFPTEIVLTFNNTIATEVEGGIKVIVIKGKIKGAASHGNKTVFTFKKSEKKDNSFLEDPNIKLFRRHLVATLKSANTIKAKDDFSLDEIEVESEFAFKVTGSAEGEWEIVPVGPSFSVSTEYGITHTISIKLSRNPKKQG